MQSKRRYYIISFYDSNVKEYVYLSECKHPANPDWTYSIWEAMEFENRKDADELAREINVMFGRNYDDWNGCGSREVKSNLIY